MPSVSFKVKIKDDNQGSGTIPEWFPENAGRKWVKLPDLSAAHIDTASFRKDPRWSGYANSDLLRGMIRRSMNEAGQSRTMWDGTVRVWLDAPGVTVDTSGFLSVVTIDIRPLAFMAIA